MYANVYILGIYEISTYQIKDTGVESTYKAQGDDRGHVYSIYIYIHVVCLHVYIVYMYTRTCKYVYL